MVANSQNNSVTEQVRTINSWYQCAIVTAIISAVFSTVICAFLLMNYGRSKMVGTTEETTLADLRLEIRSKPNDEQLLYQIRQFDLQLRQQRIRAIDRARKGSYFLLGSVIVFIISLKSAITF